MPGMSEYPRASRISMIVCDLWLGVLHADLIIDLHAVNVASSEKILKIRFIRKGPSVVGFTSAGHRREGFRGKTIVTCRVFLAKLVFPNGTNAPSN